MKIEVLVEGMWVRLNYEVIGVDKLSYKFYYETQTSSN